MRILATILTLAMLAGVAIAIDIPDIPAPSILSHESNPISTASQSTPAPTVPSAAPAVQQPITLPEPTPISPSPGQSQIPPITSQSVPSGNVVQMSTIVPAIDPALTAAGVTGSGTKADMKRYRDALVEGKIDTDTVYPMPNVMSKPASYTYRHGKVYWMNKDGSYTALPLAATVSTAQFNTWYKSSPYANPFVVLR